MQCIKTHFCAIRVYKVTSNIAPYTPALPPGDNSLYAPVEVDRNLETNKDQFMVEHYRNQNLASNNFSHFSFILPSNEWVIFRPIFQSDLRGGKSF